MSRRELPYVVECKSTYAFFEPIAAFNCDLVAVKYAQDCAITNPSYEYRVRKGKKVFTLSEVRQCLRKS